MSATTAPRWLQPLALSGWRMVHPTERDTEKPPTGWREWLGAYFPTHANMPFAPHHAQAWDWIWRIGEASEDPPAAVLVLARGGGKSTTAELGVAAVGARGTRRFVLYVSDTQDQADAHVGEIRSLFESERFGSGYAEVSSRLMSRYGQQRAWRASLLRTRSGFSVLAVGLDKAVRGIKLAGARPDMIILDDIDGHADSPDMTAKKVETITRSILPTRGPDCRVLAVQNLIHPTGVFARLSGFSGAPRADFLTDRLVIGPVPAVRDMQVERAEDGTYRIIGGEATWEGQDLARCQVQLNEWGLTAFLEEAQHEVGAPDGGMFGHLEWQRCRMEQVPSLLRTTVWCDPAVTSKDGSDAHGVQVDGIAADGTIYRLYSWEQRATPLEALKLAILKAIEYGADSVGIETDQGGDTWASVYRDACRSLGLVTGDERDEHAAATGPTLSRIPRMRQAKAGSTAMSKAERASRMLADYERGRIVHVEGTHITLERALRRFPKAKPYDLVDACFWGWYDLRRQPGKRSPIQTEWAA